MSVSRTKLKQLNKMTYHSLLLPIPECECAISSISNIAVVYPLLRFNDGKPYYIFDIC